MAMDVQWANFWVNFSLAIITLLAVLVALFKDWIWEKCNRPNIKVNISNNFPYITVNNSIFYFRMKVVNEGKTTAKNCHVKMTSIIPETPDSKFYFEPNRLKWSSSPRDMRYRFDSGRPIGEVNKNQLTPIFRENKDIPPNEGWEFCDLFQVYNGFINLTDSTKDNFPYHKNYIATATVFGDNIQPKEVNFKISPLSGFNLQYVRIDRINNISQLQSDYTQDTSEEPQHPEQSPSESEDK